MNVVRTNKRPRIAHGAGLAKHTKRRIAPGAGAAAPRILVIQLGRLGDAIQTTPLLEAVRRANASAQVDILVFDCAVAALDGVESVGVRVLRESSLPGRLSEIHARIESDRIERRPPPIELLQAFDQLGLPAYDSVLNCSYSPLAAWISQRTASKARLGATITGDGEVLFEHPAHVYLRARGHFRDQNWFNLVDLWRCTADRVTPPEKCARPFVATATDAPFQLPSGPRIALNPGSSESQRRWPAAQFAALADRLAHDGFHPILVGAPSDAAACAQVQAQCAAPVMNLCGQTSVSQMALLLSRAQLLVSNDTGAVHIASAVGCPVVGLFGATAYFAETSPWSEGNVILQGPLGRDGVCLDTNLVATAVMYCLGRADDAQLSRGLSAQNALGWKTYSLPPEADEMGGLAYWPFHHANDSAEIRFTQILRHLFAGIFCSNGAEQRSPGGGNHGPNLHKHPRSPERASLLDRVTPFVTSLERMACSAARCHSLAHRPSPSKAAEISARVAELNSLMERMKTDAEDAPAVKPVVHFLDWQCRMMAPDSPANTFRAHEREYRRAARLLTEAARRLETGA
ncbi:MAG TPA: glycosyltransferase family 9 protein [Verrucomicrobiae bacterium]|jgi:ADP-heptose:LPS heptosyltransferase|nr:glycosyltransferase family 9 protein [Verrucomicrobiae bacterium]